MHEGKCVSMEQANPNVLVLFKQHLCLDDIEIFLNVNDLAR